MLPTGWIVTSMDARGRKATNDMGTRFDSFFRRNAFDSRLRNHAFDVFGKGGTAQWELDYDLSSTCPKPYELCSFGGDLYVACGFGAPWHISVLKRNSGAYDLFLDDPTHAYGVASRLPTFKPFDSKLYMNVTFQGLYFIGRVIDASAGTWAQEDGEYIGAQPFRFNDNYLFWARSRRNSGSSWTTNAIAATAHSLQGRFTFQNLCVNSQYYWPGTGNSLGTQVKFGGSTWPSTTIQIASDGSKMYACGIGTGMYELSVFTTGWEAHSEAPIDHTATNLGCHCYNGILYVARYEEDAFQENYLRIWEFDGAAWTMTHQSLVDPFAESAYCWFEALGSYMYVCAFERIFRKAIA
jgi:hypothetical protein